MNRRLLLLQGVVAVLLAGARSLHAQEDGAELPSNGEIAKKAFLKDDELSKLIVTTANELLDDVHFLKGLEVELKVFEASDDSGDAALGVSYDYKRQIKKFSNDKSPNAYSLSMNVHANGNVAFDQDVNPADFLDTGLDLDLFQAFGGITKDTSLSNEQEAQIAGVRQKLFDDMTGEKDTVKRMRARDKVLDDIVKNLRTGDELFWKATLHASFESNQDFSSHQPVFGVKTLVTARSWNQNSSLRWLNLPDYLPALTRMATDENVNSWTPSVDALPVVLVGLDLVDPKDDDSRSGISGGDDSYFRFRGEAGFTTDAGVIAGQHLRLSASYRYFQELGASQAIRNADLERQSYFVIQLRMQSGITLTYADGKLPLDRQNDSYFTLGFTHSF